MHQHDILEFGVGDLIDGELSWQVTASSAIDGLDGPLLPGGIGIAEPSGHRQSLPEKVMLSEHGVVIEEDRPTQPWVEPVKDGHDRGHGFLSGTANKLGCDGKPALALGEDEHRPGLAADQDVAFPMSTFVPLASTW